MVNCKPISPSHLHKSQDTKSDNVTLPLIVAGVMLLTSIFGLISSLSISQKFNSSIGIIFKDSASARISDVMATLVHFTQANSALNISIMVGAGGMAVLVLSGVRRNHAIPTFVLNLLSIALIVVFMSAAIMEKRASSTTINTLTAYAQSNKNHIVSENDVLAIRHRLLNAITTPSDIFDNIMK